MKSGVTAWLFWIITIFPMFIFLVIVSTLAIIAVLCRSQRVAVPLLDLISATGEWYRKRIPMETQT